MEKIIAILLVLPLLGGVRMASAAELNGVVFPDRRTEAGKALELNGLGTRQATFLKVKVYVAGLYLENRSPDGDQILGSSQLKALEMRFVRDVGAGKMVDAWNESLEKNCVRDCDALKAPFATLDSYMSDMKSGEAMSFLFFTDHVEVTVKDKKMAAIPGEAFSRTLLATWLGAHPPNDALKDGLLSRK